MLAFMGQPTWESLRGVVTQLPFESQTSSGKYFDYDSTGSRTIFAAENCIAADLDSVQMADLLINYQSSGTQYVGV